MSIKPPLQAACNESFQDLPYRRRQRYLVGTSHVCWVLPIFEERDHVRQAQGLRASHREPAAVRDIQQNR